MARFLWLLLALLPILSQGQSFHWTTYTSTSNTVDLMVQDDAVWTATTGGLSRYDLTDGSFDVFTNTRGLAMNRTTAVGSDNREWIWIALEDGRITRLHPQTHATKQILDLQEEVYEVQRILHVGEDVFVAANDGIYRFSYQPIPDNFRVLESINVLGSFPSATPVQDVAAAHGYLYAATSVGLARASLDAQSLSAPIEWENFTTDNSGIPANNIVTMYVDQGGLLWLGGTELTFTFDGESFGNSAGLPAPPVGFVSLAYPGVVELGVFTVTADHLYRWVDDAWTQQPQFIGGITGIASFASGGSDHLVLGISDRAESPGGIMIEDEGGFAGPLAAPGIGGNNIQSVAVAPDGVVWVTSGVDRMGVYRFDGTSWNNLVPGTEFSHPWFLFDPRNIAFDPFGGAWIASQGGGVIWVADTSIVVFNTQDAEGFDNEGKRIKGIREDSDYTVTRVASSPRGDIFISDRIVESGPGPGLIRVPAEWIARGNNPDRWDYYEMPQQTSSNPTEVQELIVDPFDRIWVGPSRDGLHTFLLDPRGTFSNPADDDWFAYDPRSYQNSQTCIPDILPEVLAFAIDRQNYLWVGTPGGAYHTQTGIPYDPPAGLFFTCLFNLPVGNRVNDIHVDAHDNKWFATDEGIAVLDRDFNWIHVFQTSTSIDNASDLTSNGVTSITSDPRTGDVWVGTQDGLSRLTTPYLSRQSDLDEVWPYPNPLRADGRQRMFLDAQRLGGRFDETRIFTITGRLVRELTWSEMITQGWDGRNEEGELVAGGVYLIVATTAEGNSATGKVAVLGK